MRRYRHLWGLANNLNGWMDGFVSVSGDKTSSTDQGYRSLRPRLVSATQVHPRERDDARHGSISAPGTYGSVQNDWTCIEQTVEQSATLTGLTVATMTWRTCCIPQRPTAVCSSSTTVQGEVMSYSNGFNASYYHFKSSMSIGCPVGALAAAMTRHIPIGVTEPLLLLLGP